MIRELNSQDSRDNIGMDLQVLVYVIYLLQINFPSTSRMDGFLYSLSKRNFFFFLLVLSFQEQLCFLLDMLICLLQSGQLWDPWGLTISSPFNCQPYNFCFNIYEGPIQTIFQLNCWKSLALVLNLRNLVRSYIFLKKYILEKRPETSLSLYVSVSYFSRIQKLFRINE